MVWSLRSFSHVGSHNSPKLQREKKKHMDSKKDDAHVALWYEAAGFLDGKDM